MCRGPVERHVTSQLRTLDEAPPSPSVCTNSRCNPLDFVVRCTDHKNGRLRIERRRIFPRYFLRPVGVRYLAHGTHGIQFLETTFRVATQFVNGVPVIQLCLSLHLG